MRLIDADELMKHKGNCYDEEGHLLYAVGTGTIMRMPTIDAVPVRHGEWCGEADGYADGELVYDMWYCPFCGKRFEEWDEKPNWNYCPMCGADMRQ